MGATMKTVGIKIEVDPAILTEDIIEKTGEMSGRSIIRGLRPILCEERGHQWATDDPPDMPWTRRCLYCSYVDHVDG
jgi:hypothetical protein